jgi:ubiquinone/menaquinone biosynthesis C-methylase UbiE
MNNGDKSNFDKSWNQLKEAKYSHWVVGKPQNQIQLAFRNHWITFSNLIKKKKIKNKNVLEVGCGRGSLSAYFADNKWNCSLLDSSPKAINLAKLFFKKNKLNASFNIGDCKKLPYSNSTFGVVFSIGLLEHFQNPENIIKEQIRVLDKDGLFIAYVVPEIKNNIQNDFEWINKIFSMTSNKKKLSTNKSKIFRTSNMSKFYVKILKKLKLKNINYSGIYPLPMISHSKSFPFTLMNIESEKIIVDHFQDILKRRGANSWLCDENYGQAILIWGTKK